MSRFHRVIFHPTRPDTSPHLAPVDRKRQGKHGGHTPPPWVASPDAPAGASTPPPPAPVQRKGSIDPSSAKSAKDGKRAARGSSRRSKP